ncbi:VCBS domain-containing protein [Mameliella sediminis]|uniref:VCBS domain-containing protein n=1 Tax=Mameliella sediminis TaxID=2836866 RepID=UPI001C454E05|nr:VCBS domain-containing protein [Mameliella sediminis]
MNGTDGDDVLAAPDRTAPTKFNGGDGNDRITGSNAGDEINAGDGNDTVQGGGGDDLIRGNDGDDTAVYLGSIFDFLIYDGQGNATVVEDTNAGDGDEGTDTLKHVGTLEFADFTYSVGANNAPLVLLTDQVTDEDTPLDFSFDVFDFDGGTLVLDDLSVTGGSVSVAAPVPAPQGNYIGATYQVTFDPGTAFQYLAQQESSVQSITVQVSDGQGGVTVVSRNIIVEGVNDPVVIDAGASDFVGAVTEDDSAPLLEDTGDIAFSDVDLSDTHDVTVVLTGLDGPVQGFTEEDALGFLGVVVSDTSGVALGTATWTFAVQNDEFQYLGLGDVLTFTYDVTLSDGNGSTATETVTVTIAGVNDDPEITGDTVGRVTEDTILTAFGRLFGSDVDFETENLTWSVENDGIGEHGNISVDLFGGWTYQLNNTDPDVQNLDLGETLFDEFLFALEDGEGGRATQTVTISIFGLDDGENVINPLLQTFEDGVSGGPGQLSFVGPWRTVNGMEIFSLGRDTNPYNPALQSGMFVATNSAGEVAIARETNFDLESAYFTSPFAPTMTLLVSGYDDDVLIGTQTLTLTRGATSFVEFDDTIFDNVDEVRFEAAGQFFAMDDLLIVG